MIQRTRWWKLESSRMCRCGAERPLFVVWEDCCKFISSVKQSTKKFGLFVPKRWRNYERSKLPEILSPTPSITSQKNSTHVSAVMSTRTSQCDDIYGFRSLYTQIKIFSSSSFLNPNQKCAQFLKSLMSLWFSITNFLLRLPASSYCTSCWI